MKVKLLVLLDDTNTAIISLTNPRTEETESFSTLADIKSVAVCVAMFAAQQDIPPQMVEYQVKWPDGHETMKPSAVRAA